MIARLRGVLVEKTPSLVVIDVGGVGYLVEIPLSTFDHLPPEQQEVTLLTEMIVRDDALLLYGFATDQERRLFRLLLKVTGVGAKLALAILSSLSVEGFAQAVQDKSLAQLQKIPGVGKKTAERLLLELAESTKGFAPLPLLATATASTPALEDSSLQQDQERRLRQQAIQALEGLGYKPTEALQRVEKSWIPNHPHLSEQIKRALQVSL